MSELSELKNKEEIIAKMWEDIIKFHERQLILFKLGLFFSLLSLAASLTLIIIFSLTIK